MPPQVRGIVDCRLQIVTNLPLKFSLCLPEPSPPSSRNLKSLSLLNSPSLASMDFWCVEVKDGKPLKVKVDDNEALHISKAALRGIKNDKGNELIPLFLHANDQKFVIGTLYTGKIYNISYDLVLAKDFKLSHNWKNGSIYFCGYKIFMPEDSDDNTTDSDFGDEFPDAMENGEHEPGEENPNLTSDAKSGKITEQSKNDDSKEGEDEDSEDDSGEGDDSQDSGSEEGPMDVSGEDSSENDDDSDEDDETKES